MPTEPPPSEMHVHRDVDWSNHYEAVGSFVIAFEAITTALRFCNSALLQLDGLRTWDLGAALVSIPTISPEQLAVALASGARSMMENNPSASANKLVKRVKALAERRNEIVHGEWHIGPRVVIVGDAELPKRLGIKRSRAKDGEHIKELATADELRALSEECEQASQDIHQVVGEVISYRLDKKLPVLDHPEAVPVPTSSA